VDRRRAGILGAAFGGVALGQVLNFDRGFHDLVHIGDSRTMVAEPRAASADPPVATGAEPRQAPGSVRVRTLLYIRWFAVVGQAVALLVVHEVLELKLPLADCTALLVASVLVNLYLLLTRSSSEWLPEHEAAFSLGYDVVQLSALLYLTGGL